MKKLIPICLLASSLFGEISTSTDSFTGVVTQNTDILAPVAIYSREKDSVVEYGLNLEVSALTVAYSAVGAFVLFTDGSIWKRESEAITVTYRSGYKYNCYISLTPEEVKMFSENTISKIKLYVFENSVSEVEAVQFQNEVKQIINN